MCVVRFGTRSRLDELVDVVDQERRQVEHDGGRGGPLDVRHCLRLGALELLLGGLGWCSEHV